jgi:hypothetical protein
VISTPLRITLYFLTLLPAASCTPKKPPPATTQPVSTPQNLPGLRNFAWVTPYLARGGQPDAVGFSQLKTRGVKTIVDLRGLSHRDEIDTLGFKYIQIPSNAAKPDLTQVVQFLRFVREDQNRPVFVHDEAGSDRVGLYIAAYRIVEQGWSAPDALLEMNRFHFNPYWTQLPDFLTHLDPALVRRELASPPTTTTAPTTRKKDH